MDNKSTKSVLVIAPPKARDFILSHLDKRFFHPVACASFAHRAECDDYDCIIVCAKSDGREEKTLAASLTENGSRGVLFLVAENGYETVCSALDGLGVLVLSLPCTGKTLSEAAMMLCAMNARLSGERAQKTKLEKKISEEKLVSRAKLTLITTLGMSESEAHKYIEKQAMDMRISKRAVAENILKTYEN